MVLGASGDLARKKTFPALFNLYRLGLLPPHTKIIGYARSKLDNQGLHDRIVGHLKNVDSAEDQVTVKNFLELTSYIPGAYDDDISFEVLEQEIQAIEKQHGVGGGHPHRLFYMALPPSVFITVATHLERNCYSPTASNRIVLEKPFGKDLASCHDMLTALKPLWSEEETYREC